MDPCVQFPAVSGNGNFDTVGNGLDEAGAGLDEGTEEDDLKDDVQPAHIQHVEDHGDRSGGLGDVGKVCAHDQEQQDAGNDADDAGQDTAAHGFLAGLAVTHGVEDQGDDHQVVQCVVGTVDEPVGCDLALGKLRGDVAAELGDDGDKEDDVHGVQDVGPEGQDLLDHLRALEHQEHHAHGEDEDTDPLAAAGESGDHAAGSGIQDAQNDEHHQVVQDVIQESQRPQQLFHHGAVVVGLEDANEFEGDGAHHSPDHQGDQCGEEASHHAAGAEVLCDLGTGSVSAADGDGLENESGDQPASPFFLCHYISSKKIE